MSAPPTPAPDRATATRSTAASVSVVATLARAGVVVGMWQVVWGPDGIVTENLAPFLLHALGSLATVAAVVAGPPVIRLVALAFTGYSTIALGMSARQPLAALLWVSGALAVAALGVSTLRRRTHPARWAWVLGVLLAITAAVVVTLVGLSR